MIWLLFFDIRI